MFGDAAHVSWRNNLISGVEVTAHKKADPGKVGFEWG